jgi:hypothetical protein
MYGSSNTASSRAVSVMNCGARYLFPQTLAAAIAGAVRVAARHWLDHDTTDSFADVLSRTLSHVLPSADPSGT